MTLSEFEGHFYRKKPLQTWWLIVREIASRGPSALADTLVSEAVVNVYVIQLSRVV